MVIFAVVKRRTNILFTLIVMIFMTIGYGYGQNSATQQYPQLIEQFARLKSQQDSLSKLAEHNRELVAKNPDKQAEYSKVIIALENQIYDLRTPIASLASQISAMEQENPSLSSTKSVVLSSSSSRSPQMTDGSKEGANIFETSYFKANLTPEQRQMFNNAGSVGSLIAPLQREVTMLYSQLGKLSADYMSSIAQEQVDQLLVASINQKEKIRQTDVRISELWRDLYRAKLDAYAVMNDKLGVDRGLLERVDSQEREVRRARDLAAQGLAPASIMYDKERELVLRYELLLAQNLGLVATIDSLNTELSKIEHSSSDYPDIVFSPRNLIVYSDITLDGKYGFETVDDIPLIKLPKQGVYYAIQVAAMSAKPSKLSFFRGGNPLQLNKMSNGTLQYVLGGFRTYEKAQKAVAQMQKAGYKAPILVAWLDGASVSPTKAKAAESAETSGVEGYQILVKSDSGTIGKTLRDVVDFHAKDKQIARSQQDGGAVYTIIEFANRDEAELIARLIKEREKAEVTVEAIKQNAPAAVE